MFARSTLVCPALLALSLLCAGSIATAGQININTADATALSRELHGIGMKRAQAIVDYRKAHGAFKSADELALVKGIGPAAIAKNRSVIIVDQRPAPRAVPNGQAPTGR